VNFQQLEVEIPTYIGGDDSAFGPPLAVVRIENLGEGLVVTLPTVDDEGPNEAVILIEKRPRGWFIGLEPLSGGDIETAIFLEGHKFTIQPGTQSEQQGLVEIVDAYAKVDLLMQPEESPTELSH